VKTFNQTLIKLPKLKQINEESGRRYVKDQDMFGVSYPSITTILSSLNKDHIIAWRKRVGEEEANKVMRQASRRGTKTHLMVEDYIQNKGIPEAMPNEMNLFLQLKTMVDQHLDNVAVIEGGMMSDHLRAAGTVDCIAEWDGQMSIIDWKTSKKPKRRDWIKNYFMQAAAYAVMFEENTDIPVRQLVIAMACEDGESRLYIEDRDTWIDEFIKVRDQYEKSQKVLAR
tara:strand:+ start:2774 stop:3454 length:681 start_codon:yes stop_codon:yes gene_type:complete